MQTLVRATRTCGKSHGRELTVSCPALGRSSSNRLSFQVLHLHIYILYIRPYIRFRCDMFTIFSQNPSAMFLWSPSHPPSLSPQSLLPCQCQLPPQSQTSPADLHPLRISPHLVPTVIRNFISKSRNIFYRAHALK